MRLISNSEQNFGQWARRLVTMEKFKENIIGEHAKVHNVKGLDNLSLIYQRKDVSNEETDGTNEKGKKKPGHHLFREKVRFLCVLK